jgi:hypothetical protein
MMDLLLYYFLGLLVATDLLFVWNVTNFPIHVCKFILKDDCPDEGVHDRDSWENWCILRLGTFGEMLVCPICHGHWLSLFVGLVFTICFPLPWGFPFVAMFTYPVLGYLVLNTVKP